MGQAPPKEGEEGKVSNDDPARPLQMPPASTEVKEAFDDFERFQRRGAWERAFKALYTIPEAQALRFVDGEDGYIVTAAWKRRRVLAALLPAGRAAYRLFYDAEAKKLVDEAEGTAELRNLERVYSAYFTSSIGDNAADRLGDLYFERGRFDRAADCWLSVVRDRPDTDLSPGLLTLKAALALERAGRRAELEEARAELEKRYGDERVTLGGESAPAAELLRRWVRDDRTAAGEPVPGPGGGQGKLDLSGPVEPLWQVRFADSVEAGMDPAEQTKWESHPLSAAVPAATVDGTTLFVNDLGFVFAVDAKSGKMLWRTEALHHLRLLTIQDQTRMIDPTRFAIVAAGDHVFTLGRSLKEQNQFVPHTLTCRRAEGGEVVWQSPDLADYAKLDLNGPPIIADGKLFVAAKSLPDQQQQRTPQQFLLAIRPHDGKVLWKTEVGTFRQGQRFFFYNRVEQDPQPQLVHRGGAIYVDTHVGILARLDADSGELDWGYGYRTEPYQSANRFFFYFDEPQESKAATATPFWAGESFLVKGVQSSRVCAVEPDRMKRSWERPMAKATRLLGVGRHAVFLGGDEVSALDLKTRALLWATRVPGGSLQGRVLVQPEGLWQLTSRGIYEIDPETGTVRRIFRGADLGSVGGDLLLTGDLLLAVSNRTITAYPRQPGKEIQSHE
jgi:outer membrane protein assembly factor BamB/TolA-binding protein